MDAIFLFNWRLVAGSLYNCYSRRRRFFVAISITIFFGRRLR